MKIHKLYIALGFVIAFFLFFELAAHASELNQETIITFSAPIQIPGKVLPAGTYIFEQADPAADQNLIRIYSADRKVAYATLNTIAERRFEPTGDVSITLAEPETGNPILVGWFFPGNLTGHEFIYPKDQERQIAQDRKETVVGNHTNQSTTSAGVAGQ